MENKQTPESQPAKNEESIFSGDEFNMEGYDKHIRQARNALYIAAGVLTFNLVILLFSYNELYVEYIWIDITIWTLFIAGFILLGIWTKKKPYYAIISGLILYGLFIALNAFIDVNTLYKGIFMKIIIIGLLIKGINDAKAAQEMKDQFM